MASVRVPSTGDSSDCPTTVARAAPPLPAKPDRELPPIKPSSCCLDIGGELRKTRLLLSTRRFAGPVACTVTLTSLSCPPSA